MEKNLKNKPEEREVITPEISRVLREIQKGRAFGGDLLFPGFYRKELSLLLEKANKEKINISKFQPEIDKALELKQSPKEYIENLFKILETYLNEGRTTNREKWFKSLEEQIHYWFWHNKQSGQNDITKQGLTVDEYESFQIKIQALKSKLNTAWED
ncbi:MAG TPA: hypothetical protein VGO63_00215 [Candidatus Paceibacterota bacterium]|nr:hypothetical protein [Candidatus Paceibacterota bacterium]